MGPLCSASPQPAPLSSRLRPKQGFAETRALREARQAPAGHLGRLGPWPVVRRSVFVTDARGALYETVSVPHRKKKNGALMWAASRRPPRCHSGASVAAFIKELSALLSLRPRGSQGSRQPRAVCRRPGIHMGGRGPVPAPPPRDRHGPAGSLGTTLGQVGWQG